MFFSLWVRESYTHDTYDTEKTILDMCVELSGKCYGETGEVGWAPSDTWRYVERRVIFPESGDARIHLQIHGYATQNGAVFQADDISFFRDEHLSVKSLSIARSRLVATAVGKKAFFAGGADSNDAYDTVDIYDADENQWYNAVLSEPRRYLAATSCENKAFLQVGQIYLLTAMPLTSTMLPRGNGLQLNYLLHVMVWQQLR